MATIEKRGKSYRVTVSLAKKGGHQRTTKTFKNKKDAQLWALEMEVEKGKGKDLAERSTYFPDFYRKWVYTVKKNDVREATFINYQRTIKVVNTLFDGMQLKNLNDLVMQKQLDHYAENHAKKTTRELVLKIRGSLKYAYARGLIANDFGSLLKGKGKEVAKRNVALSISEMRILRTYCLAHPEDEFNTLALLALETGGRRGELLGLQKEDLYQYGIKIRRSLSPTNSDQHLKTKHSRRDIAINQEVYEAVKKLADTKENFIFDAGHFKQAGQLHSLLNKLNLRQTTFHGLRDSHASFLFSQDIDLAYISKRLGHDSIQTTQNYYLELMPEKKHQQDADALNLLKKLTM